MSTALIATADRRRRRGGFVRIGALPGVAPIVMLVCLVVAWQLLVDALSVPGYLLPAPSEIAAATIENRALLWEHTAVTMLETLVGFVLAAVVGVALAVVMIAWPLAGRAMYPILVSSQVIPKVAVAPLIVVWIGAGVLTSSLIAFVMAFFPVVVNTAQGLSDISGGSKDMLLSMRASTWQIFRYLRFPSALPHIATGLQLAVAFAIVGAIVGEFVGSSSGLGYLLLVSQGNLRTDLLFADLVILTVLGLVLYYGVELLGRLILRRR